MTNQKSLEDACLDIKCGTTIEFHYKEKKYRICIRRPFRNTEKGTEPIRLEPNVRTHKNDNGIVISSIEIEFAGEHGDRHIVAITFKIRGQQNRIKLEAHQVSVIDRDTGETTELILYLETLRQGTVVSN